MPRTHGNAASPEPPYNPPWTSGPFPSSGARASPGASSAHPPVPRGCAGRLKKGARPLTVTHPAPPRPPELAVGTGARRCQTLPTVDSAVSSSPNPRLPTPLKPRHSTPLLLRSRARRRRAPGAQPAVPLPAALSPPANTPNRPLVGRRPFPSPSPANSGDQPAGISPEPRRQRPQGLHCETQILSRVPAAKG
jgi:hypothetical protein